MQIVKTVQVGGLVHSMLYEGGFLFVGLQMTPQQDLAAPSAVKVYHLQSGSEDTLDGLTVSTMPLLDCTIFLPRSILVAARFESWNRP